MLDRGSLASVQVSIALITESTARSIITAKSITMGPFFQNDHTSLKTPSGAAIMPVFFPTKEYLSN